MPLLPRRLTWAAALLLLAASACQRNGGVVEVTVEKDKQENKEEPKAQDTKKGENDKTDNKGRSVPMFGGSPSRNMVNLVEKGLVEDFAPDVKDSKTNPKGVAKNMKWKAKLGGYAYGGPVIAGGRIFVGTNNDEPRDEKIEGDRGVLMCFRESDGEFLWQLTHEKGEEENDSAKQGIISTPCVDGERVYYVSNRGEFVCADVKGDGKTKKGKILWSIDMVKEFDVFVGQASSSSPLVVGDLVYALTGNGVIANTGKLPKPKAPALVALNKITGKKVWTNNLPGENVIRGQWSNPTAATVDGKTQIIYAGGDGWLYSLDAKTGELNWKFDLNPKKATPYKIGGGGEKCFVVATPVVHDNKCYVAVGQEPDDGSGVGHLWCIDVTKKPTNKDKDVSPVSTTVTVGKDSDERFDPKDAKNKDSALVWHHGGKVLPKPKDDEREFVFSRTLSSVAVHDGIVYAAELMGIMQVLDARTGQKLWEHDFQSSTWCSPYYVDGKIYEGCDDGLYVFKPGRKANEPKKVVFGKPIKVPPVACNGVLYVNSGAYLYAFGKK
jgi:outer membrane protein assembly factor BamB